MTSVIHHPSFLFIGFLCELISPFLNAQPFQFANFTWRNERNVRKWQEIFKEGKDWNWILKPVSRHQFSSGQRKSYAYWSLRINGKKVQSFAYLSNQNEFLEITAKAIGQLLVGLHLVEQQIDDHFTRFIPPFNETTFLSIYCFITVQ